MEKRKEELTQCDHSGKRNRVSLHQVHLRDPEVRLRLKKRARVTYFCIVLVKVWSHPPLTHHCLSCKRDGTVVNRVFGSTHLEGVTDTDSSDILGFAAMGVPALPNQLLTPGLIILPSCSEDKPKLT